MSDAIHPTAQIDPRARLGARVSVGAFTIVGPDVRVADDVELGHHVVLEGRVELAERVRVGQQQKWTERFLRHGDASAPAGIDPHRSPGRLERQQAAARIVPEEQGIVVERERKRGQFSVPSRRWSSRRAGV